MRKIARSHMVLEVKQQAFLVGFGSSMEDGDDEAQQELEGKEGI